MKKENYIYTEKGNRVTLTDTRTNTNFRGELYIGDNGKTYARSQDWLSMTMIAKYRKNFVK